MAAKFNFRALRQAVCEAARRAFNELRAKYPQDLFYAFALYTSGEAAYLIPTANSEQGLAQKVQEYRLSGHAASAVDDGLRWSPCDWAYHGHGDRHFKHVDELLRLASAYDLDDDAYEIHLARILNAFIGGLKDLDKQKFFGTGKSREQVVLLLMMGDQEDTLLLECAKKLNPAAVYRKFAEPFAYPTRGNFIEVGSRKCYEMMGVSVSSDGATIATAGDYFVFAFGLPGYVERLKKRTQVSIWNSALSPNGKLLAVAWSSGFSHPGGVERWDMAQGKALPRLPTEKGGVWSVAWSPDSRLLCSGGADKVIRLWQGATGELIREMKEHRDEVHGLCFSPDGVMLASIDRSPGSLRLWDVANGECHATLNDCGESLAWSPDGARLAVVSGYADKNARDVRLWNVANRELVSRIPLVKGRAGAHVVALSRDGRWLATGSYFPGRVELWDIATCQLLLELDPHYEFVSGLAFLPDDRTIAVVGRSHRRPPLLLWDISAAQT